jgi:uncharacterized membrane protein
LDFQASTDRHGDPAAPEGSPGQASHPPLTDASIGAYTAAVAMLVAGALGVETAQMAHGALLALSVGLILAAPTAATGLLDWQDLPKHSPARTTATLHVFMMVTATVLFALTSGWHSVQATWTARSPRLA